jgi:N utilization substance protein B
VKEKRRPSPVARAAARLGAVQALYQMDIAGTDLAETLAQFASRSAGENFDDGECGEADYRHLKEVVEGVVREQTAAWPLHRLDATVRAILRAAAYELMFMEKVPARAAVSEYVDVAAAFFGDTERGFINGVLDRLARQRRPSEFAA